MTTESSAMYTSSLLTSSTSAPLITSSVSAPTPTTSPPISAPLISSPSPNTSAAAAAAAATAAAAAAAAQVQVITADTKNPVTASTIQQQTIPNQAPIHMPQMAAAAAFQQYAPSMVFAAQDPTVIEDQPTYVNPKQYARILKRRESRKKQTGTDVTSYTPRKRSYMHESRHKHAMQRRRGPGGRFLSKEEREDLSRAQMKEASAVGQ